MYNYVQFTMYNYVQFLFCHFFILLFAFLPLRGTGEGALDYFISFCQHLRRFTISGFSGFHCDSSFTFDSS